jgi:hypothetical protein
MATRTDMTIAQELTQKEGERLFDAQARRYLSMSGDEFRRRWESGEFDGQEERAPVMRVAMLLPLAR